MLECYRSDLGPSNIICYRWRNTRPISRSTGPRSGVGQQMMQKSWLSLGEAPEDRHEGSRSAPSPLSLGGPIVFVPFKLCILITLRLFSLYDSVMATFVVIPVSRQSSAGSPAVFGESPAAPSAFPGEKVARADDSVDLSTDRRC